MLFKKWLLKSVSVFGLIFFLTAFSACSKKDYLTDPLLVNEQENIVHQNESVKGFVVKSDGVERFPLYYDNSLLFWPSYLSFSEVEAGVRFHVYYKKLSTDKFSRIGVLTESSYTVNPYTSGYYFVLKGVNKEPATAVSYFYPETPEGFDESVFDAPKDSTTQSLDDPLIGIGPTIVNDLDY